MRHSIKAERAFKRLGRNFMTPTALAYYEIDGEAVELSEGTGMDHQPIFGVTFRRLDGESPAKDRSKLFQSKVSAISYLGSIMGDARTDEIRKRGAAPMMYDALKDVADYFENPRNEGLAVARANILEIVYGAIAAAEGRSAADHD